MGLNFAKGEIRHATLSGSKANPTFVSSGRLEYDPKMPVCDMMNHFRSQIAALTAQYKPDRLTFRLFPQTTNAEQPRVLHYPGAIACIHGYDEGLPVEEVGHQSITVKRLGLPKGTILDTEIDNRFGKHPPYWDEQQRKAVAVAWYGLP